MWPRLVNTLLGLWLMAAPDALGYGRPASTSDRIVGPLVVTFAITALWGATRPLRWVNLPLGLWLIIAPLALGYSTTAAVNSIAAGVVISAAACIRGHVRHTFDGGWSMLWRRNPPPPSTRHPITDP